MMTILSYVLPFSADLYFFLELELASSPLNIAKWFADDISAEDQFLKIAEFVASPSCCDDSGLSKKVLDHLLNHVGWICISSSTNISDFSFIDVVGTWIID